MSALNAFRNLPRFGGTGGGRTGFGGPQQQIPRAANDGRFGGGGFRAPQQQPTSGIGIGLGGAEQAQGQTIQDIFAALTGAQNQSNAFINQGTNAANAALFGGEQGALNQLNQFFGAGNDAFNRGNQAFNRGNEAFQRGIGSFQRGGEQIGQGITGLDPFSQRGGEAQKLALALAGGAGSEAAFANFEDSPGQQFLRDRGEQAVLRNAAATGGTGGGNVLKELQQFGTGLAAQQVNNRIGQLSGLGAQGLQAAQSQGQLFGQQGALSGQEGQFQGQQGQFQGQQGQFLGQQGQFLGQRGLAGAEVRGQGALQRGQNLFNAGTLASSGALGTGSQFANALSGVGQQQAANRLLTGQQLAGSRTGQAGQLSGLAGQQGSGLANLTGQQAQQLMQLLTGAGGADSQTLQNFAALLGNISTGAGSSLGGLGGIPGIQPADNSTRNAGIGGIATLLAALISGSDRRLKANIKPIGKLGAHKFYTWDWKDEAKAVFGHQPTIGVIAQEAVEITPDAVLIGSDGYLRVDYKRLF